MIEYNFDLIAERLMQSGPTFQRQWVKMTFRERWDYFFSSPFEFKMPPKYRTETDAEFRASVMARLKDESPGEAGTIAKHETMPIDKVREIFNDQR